MFSVNLQASISAVYRYRYHINGSSDHINRRIISEDQWNIFWIQKNSHPCTNKVIVDPTRHAVVFGLFWDSRWLL